MWEKVISKRIHSQMDSFVFICSRFTKGTNGANDANGLLNIQYHQQSKKVGHQKEDEQWGNECLEENARGIGNDRRDGQPHKHRAWRYYCSCICNFRQYQLLAHWRASCLQDGVYSLVEEGGDISRSLV